MSHDPAVPPRDPQARSRATREWRRDPAARKIAGVCAGLAEELGVSVTVVRAAFVVLALPFFSGLGIVLYLVLWFLMPSESGRSGLDQLVDNVSRWAADPPRRPGRELARRHEDELDL